MEWAADQPVVVTYRDFLALARAADGIEYVSAGFGTMGNWIAEFLAAKEKNGTKVSYVLDVSDGGGKRVNRFTGEEIVPGNPSRDPWAAITPPVSQSITAKATGAFVAWLPSARANRAMASDALAL